MMRRPAIIRRARARQDIEDATWHYLGEAGSAVAERFVAAVETALRHVVAHPAAGSTRYAVPTGYPDLRFWPVKGFPYLIFYLDRGEWLDVWRVLHAKRDIPSWLSPEE